MRYKELVDVIAELLKGLDEERPVHTSFRPGIGPFGEPQIVAEIARRLSSRGLAAQSRRTPDMAIAHDWAIAFTIVRPFGDNGKEAENWSVNLLHPYPGNVSLIGDAIKLCRLKEYKQKGPFLIGYEHDPVKISLEPLLRSFEVIAGHVMGISLGERVEEKRAKLVHPEHQVLRCIGWEAK